MASRNQDDYISRQKNRSQVKRELNDLKDSVNNGIKPGPSFHISSNQPQPDIHTRAHNLAAQHSAGLPSGSSQPGSPSDWKRQFNNQPAMSFDGSVQSEDRPEYMDLLTRLSKSGVNAHLVDTDLGHGFKGKAVSITQSINNEQIESHVIFGTGGATYLSNPRNKTSLRPISTLASLDDNGNVNWQNPIDRITHMVNNPTYVNDRGQSKTASLVSLAQHQGADLLAVDRLAAQPGIHRWVADSVQVNQSQRWQGNDIINAINRSDQWTKGELLLANGASTAHTVESRRAVIASSLDGLITSKNKREKNYVGQSNTLTRGVGNMMERGHEPFYFEGQDAPNSAYTVREARDMFGMQPEGSAYQSNLYAARGFKRTVTLPKGAGYNADTKELTMGDGTVISPQTYYGRKIGRISEQYTRAGGQNLFHQIFGFKSGSAESTFIEKLNPVFDKSGNFTGKADIEGYAMSEDAAMKYAGKEMYQRINRGAMPRNAAHQSADVWGIFPDEGELPAYALQVLKAESGTTERFSQFFGRVAASNGKDQDWINTNFQNGRVSSEAAPMVVSAAIANIRERLHPIQQQNVTISQTQYDATRNAYFHQSYDDASQAPSGSEFSGPTGDFRVPVIPNTPGNVTQNANGTYTIGERNDLRAWTTRSVNVRTSGSRNTMNLKPGTLDAMSQYNPELFGAMKNIMQANLVNNRAYNQVSSFRANYEPEQRSQVEKTFGIAQVDHNKVLGIQNQIMSDNPNATPEDVTRGLLKGLRSEYGNASLEVNTPQGSILLPNAASIASGLSEDPNSREFVSNFGSRSAALIQQSAQVAANKANGIEDNASVEALRTLASQTYSSLSENANTEGTLQRATGLELPRLGGVIQGSGMLGNNEVVRSLKYAMKTTGMNADQLRQMASAGNLNTNIVTYPFSDPQDQFIGAKTRFYEDMPEDFRKMHPNPGKNIITSLEVASVMHRDFDEDRLQAMDNYRVINGQLVGGDTQHLSTSGIMARTKNKFESEYQKQIENYGSRSGYNKARAFGGALFKTSMATLGSMFRSEEGAKSAIGPVYNGIFRSFGGAVNSATQKLYGAEDPISRRMAGAIGDINSYATQSLVDTKNNHDTNLEKLITYSAKAKRSGNTFSAGRNNRIANSPEEFYHDVFSSATRVGSNVSDEEYQQKLAPAVATTLISRDELQSLQQSGGDTAVQGRISQMSDLLVHQRLNPGSDMSDEIMDLTGTSRDTDGQVSFTKWGQGQQNKGIGSLSGVAQWMGGRLGFNRYNSAVWKNGKPQKDANGQTIHEGVLPDYGNPLNEAGQQALATGNFKDNLDHPVNGVEGVANQNGASNAYQQFVQNLLPRGGSAAKEMADRFRQRLTPVQQAQAVGGSLFDPNGNARMIPASQWATGDTDQEELQRLSNLNTSNPEHYNGFLAQVKEKLGIGNVFNGKPNNAAKVGEAMEGALGLGLKLTNQGVNAQVKVQNDLRRAHGYADFLYQGKSGNYVLDAKTKNDRTMASDILSPHLSPEIMGQLGIYSEELGAKGAIVAGIRQTDNPAADQDTLMSGFEAAHTQMTQYWNQDQIPDAWKNAGRTQAEWDESRTSSLQLMQDIYEQHGVKVGARVVSQQERTDFLNAHQSNVMDLQTLNESSLSGDPQQRAEQIRALKEKGSIPHTARNIPAGNGGSPPNIPPTNNVTAASGSSGMPSSGSTPLNASSGGGESVINNTVYQARTPQISDKAIVEAAVAFKQLTEGAHNFAEGSKEARQELVKHYEALKTVSNYVSDVERATSRGEDVSGRADYQTFQSILGTGRSGGSAVNGIRQAEQSIRPDALQAMMDLAQPEGAKAPQGFGSRLAGIAEAAGERLIKGQGLFHAKLALNALVSPIVSEAKQYQNYQAGISQSLYQNGAMSYDQLMQGSYGTVLRRESSFEQARLSFGQQALSAYSPFINATVSPETANGPLGAIGAIGVPALGVGIAATSVTGNPLAGAAAFAGTAAIGVSGYISSASNPTDIRAKLNLGKQIATGNGGFQAQLGQATNNNSISGTGNLFVDASTSIINALSGGKGRGLFPGQQRNEQNEALYKAVQSYSAGNMTLQDLKTYYPGVNQSDIAAGAADQTIQELGFKEGLQSQQGNDLYSSWMTYHDKSPTGDLEHRLSGLFQANIDPTNMAHAAALAQGVNMYDKQAMGRLTDWATIRLSDAQANGQNPGLYEQQYISSSQAIASTASAQRLAKQATVSTDLYNQWTEKYGPDTANALLGTSNSGAQLGLTDPDYYNHVGASNLRKAKAAYMSGDAFTGGMLTQQTMAGEGLYNNLLNLGGSVSQAAQVSQTYAGMTNPQQISLVNSALSGNRMSQTIRGRQTGNLALQTMNTDTGMDVFYRNVPQSVINSLRSDDPYNMMAGVTDRQAQSGTLGMAREATLAQRTLAATQYGAQVQSRDINYNLQTGNLGAVKGLYGQSGMGFNAGNGMGYNQLEDANRLLNRDQQKFGYQQETANLGIQQAQFNLQGQQFYTNFDLQTRQFQYNTNYQRQSMNIDRSHQVTQQGWQKEDLAFNRSELDIHFGWQQEDYTRNIRYARGREKRDLIREQGRSTIEYAMQAGHSDQLANRNQTQVQWETQDFERKKAYFEQGVKFTQEEMGNQKKFFEQGRELDKQRLDLQKQAHDRQLIWMQEGWKLEDQRVLLDRQNYQYNYNQQVTLDTAGRKTTITVQQLGDAIDHANQKLQEMTAYANTLAGQSSIVSGGSGSTGSIGSTAYNIGSAIGSVIHKITSGGYAGTVINGVALPSVSGTNANGTSISSAGHGFASGGYTGDGPSNQVAGVTHYGEVVVPVNGMAVVRGHDPQTSQKQEEMVRLLEATLKVQQAILQKNTSFTAVLNGKASPALPVNLNQQNRSRI